MSGNYVTVSWLSLADQSGFDCIDEQQHTDQSKSCETDIAERERAFLPPSFWELN